MTSKLKWPRSRVEYHRQIENATVAGYVACLADRGNGIGVPKRVVTSVRRKIRAEFQRWLNS